MVLVVVAVICVPWMLLTRPLILRARQKRREREGWLRLNDLPLLSACLPVSFSVSVSVFVSVSLSPPFSLPLFVAFSCFAPDTMPFHTRVDLSPCQCCVQSGQRSISLYATVLCVLFHAQSTAQKPWEHSFPLPQPLSSCTCCMFCARLFLLFGLRA